MNAASDGDDRLRSALGALLGALALSLPILIGRMDLPTLLIVSAIGGLAILPVWRYAGGRLNSPLAIVAFLEIVVGPIVIALLFSGLAIWTYIGAWAVTLSVMRFATGWRDAG